ncbi:lipoate--protein ligase family protein [Urbifossiella limnaea]|uniref:Putative lipoate-protein ligase A n=1 Tax=Urbifossiella limnaea TaxID=2528023 RepID=A0A517XXK8_9BACT|nr:biotin/lipoate A/B protein ligase family protein [Urbifossiella limnaea]QDU22211.1 putative lipoate-protein ligase A [Urbifossiella limnaea]
MTLLDLTLPTAAENLALDEALLLAAEDGTGGEVLRLWTQPTPAVVVGAGGSVAIDVNREACAADGVPVVRRSSGGGTVLLDPGCLCVSVVLRTDRPGLGTITDATALVMGRLREAVRAGMSDVVVAGSGDLAAGGRKLAGSAQQRKRTHLLHHASILGPSTDTRDRIARYLRPPEREPAYRVGRDHLDFLACVLRADADLRRDVIAVWEPVGVYPNPPIGRVRELVAEKYGRDEWNLRR